MMKKKILFIAMTGIATLMAACTNELHEKKDVNTKAESTCPEDTASADNGGYHGNVNDWGGTEHYETSPQ